MNLVDSMNKEETMYEKLFSEGQIGPVTVRNRVIMSPMDDCLDQASGEVTQRGVECGN